ncbi:MAG: hypothetical protein ACREAE_08130 [Nitrosopumilaceae archaeon]
MIRVQNIHKSTKKIGKHEKIIIKKLQTHFEKQGYDVIPHASLNIAWGSIISDLDLLLIKSNQLTIIEVKSSHDNLQRARRQIRNIQDYVDFAYVATDYYPRKWNMHHIGFIVANGKIDIIKEAKQITKLPNPNSISSLKKICLSRMLGYSDDSKTKNILKTKLASYVQKARSHKNLKDELKEIVTCGEHCDSSCPIWSFENNVLDKVLDSKIVNQN